MNRQLIEGAIASGARVRTKTGDSSGEWRIESICAVDYDRDNVRCVMLKDAGGLKKHCYCDNLEWVSTPSRREQELSAQIDDLKAQLTVVRQSWESAEAKLEEFQSRKGFRVVFRDRMQGYHDILAKTYTVQDGRVTFFENEDFTRVVGYFERSEIVGFYRNE